MIFAIALLFSVVWFLVETIDTMAMFSHHNSKYWRFNFHLNNLQNLEHEQRESSYWLMQTYHRLANYADTDKEVNELMRFYMKEILNLDKP